MCYLPENMNTLKSSIKGNGKDKTLLRIIAYKNCEMILRPLFSLLSLLNENLVNIIKQKRCKIILLENLL